MTAQPRAGLGLAAVLAGVQLLAVLDSLAAALALRAIDADLGLGASGAAWVLNATSVALAGGLLVAGRLGDSLGERRLFLAGTALLGLGAAVAGAAVDVATLLAGRVLLGLGAALAFPSALALTNRTYAEEPARSRAFAVTAIAGAGGSVGGAVYGGAVTDLLGWRWVFWLTVPVIAALCLAAHRVLPASATGRPRRSLDLPGAALATTALASLAAGVIGLGTRSLSTSVAGGLLVGSLLAVVLLALQERRAADPILPARLLRSPRLLGGCAGMAAGSALWTAVVFVHAQHLQDQGWSASRAGTALVPASAGIVLAAALVVPRASRRIGPVAVAGLGLATSAVTLALLAPAVDLSWTYAALPLLLALGAGLAAIRAGLLDDALGGGPEADGGVTAAVFESSAHVGGALAVTTYAAAIGLGGYGAAYLAAGALGAAGLLGVIGAARAARRRPPGGPAPSDRRRRPGPRGARRPGRTTAARG